MGEGIDNIEQAITIDDPFNYLINLLRLQPDHEALGDAVVTLTPHQAAHIFELTDRRGADFLDRTTQCPANFAEPGVVDERSCLWALGSGGNYERAIVLDSPINKDEWQSLTMGGQGVVKEHVALGFGLDLGQVNSTQTRDDEFLSSLSGELYQANLSAAYRNSGFGVTFVAAGAMGNYETVRHVQVDGFEQTYSSFDGVATNVADVGELPAFSDKTIEFEGINGFATADAQIYALNPRLRLSYSAGAGGFEAMGFIDLDGHLMYTPERTETGVGLANLTYPEMLQTAVTVTPGIELSVAGQLDNALSSRRSPALA